MRTRNRWQSGFTIIELLVVIALIGIIAAFVGFNVSKWVQSSRLREAAYQVMGDLRRARSQAQLTSQDSTVWLCPSSVASTACTTSNASPSTIYTTSWGATSDVRAGVQKTLPYGIKIAPAIATATSTNYPNSVVYSSPYAGTDGIGTVWSLRSTNGSEIFIKVVGVTGKVAISGSVN